MNKFVLILFSFLIMPICSANVVIDDFAKETLINSPKPKVNLEYNYTDTERIPIKMKLVRDYGNENDVYEGQEVELKLIKDVIYKGRVIVEKGSKATAKINIIISTGMNGIPASIILENFNISTISQTKLVDRYELFGQDRSLLVFPLKWALTILPPTGSFTNFIMGGHSRLKPSKIITIYYYPNWK